MSAHSGALEAVERVVNRGGEPAAVLAQVTAILRERLGDDVTLAADGFVVHRELDEAEHALIERVSLLASPYRS